MFRRVHHPFAPSQTLASLVACRRLCTPLSLVACQVPNMATAEGRRPSVAFLTTLDDTKGSAVTDTLPNNQNDQTVDSLSTSTSTLQVAPGCSESGSNSNSRVESLSRDSRRGRDVKSAEVDLIRYQPLPGSVRLANVTEKVPGLDSTSCSNHTLLLCDVLCTTHSICIRKRCLTNQSEMGVFQLCPCSTGIQQICVGCAYCRLRCSRGGALFNRPGIFWGDQWGLNGS